MFCSVPETSKGARHQAQRKGTLRCPLCAGEYFYKEESRQDSRWGFASHRMTLMICQRCRYVLHFYDSNSIFDLD